MLDQYEEELSQTKKMRKEILENARREAENLLANTNREIEKTIRVIRETQAEKEQTKEARKELEVYKDKHCRQAILKSDSKLENKLGEIQKHARKLQERAGDKNLRQVHLLTSRRPLMAGDQVRILKPERRGEVLEINGENVLVTYGESMITSVKGQ